MRDHAPVSRAGSLLWAAFGWFLLSLPAIAASPVDPARVQEITAFLAPAPAGFGKPLADRAAWEELARKEAFAAVLIEAEKLAKEPVPALPDDLFLDYSRTGNRDRCQKVLSARGGRVVTFALAECVENQGRFLPRLTQTIEAICSERTWVYPAHDGKLDNFNGRAREMDLRATAVAWELATADYVLGDKLTPATRQLIREQVRSRVLVPYREMVAGQRPAVHWLRATHNWNAVCLAGVTGAALALEDSPADRAWFVAAAERYIQSFLSGFTADGYCSEGMGYWNYGFGHFLMLGEAVRQATGGRVDLLAAPSALQPALYCTRTEILDGLYPTISDCSPGSQPSPAYRWYIAERFGLKPYRGKHDFAKPAGSLTTTLMFTFLPQPLPPVPHAAIPADSPLRTWFPDGGVLICRPEFTTEKPLAVVLKGGNNAEHHNHNDVGSFSVVAGTSMVICDPGAEVYTARTFSSRRYESTVLSSYGHAVPKVAGRLQRSGAAARAVIRRSEFTEDRDTLVLDLTSAYQVPELEELERAFVYQRAPKTALTVTDRVTFTTPQSYETALITWGRWKRLSNDELLIQDKDGAVRVRIDAGGLNFTIRSELLSEQVRTPTLPTRIAITLNASVPAATVKLTIQAE